MPTKASRPATLAACGPRKDDLAGASITFQNTQLPQTRQAQTARIVRLPIFRDGVWIGNHFLKIGPGLRARIREMAREARP
jgi:hypothetical protein